MKSAIILIANPAAKGASPKKIRKAAELLRSASYEVEVAFTEKQGDAEECARKASQNGDSFIVAAGGDGTFNEVMNGMAMGGARLALLPMGTTNVLAKELCVPEDLEGAVAVVLTGKEHLVSLGRVTLPQLSPPVTRYFCLMAGIGFDGETVYGINPALKKYWGKTAYILSGLKTLAGYSPAELTFAVNGQSLRGYSAVIGKSSKYGGHFRITPDASLERPELYACIMQGKGRTDILRYAAGVLAGRHLGFRDIIYLRTDSVSIRGEAPVQVDGDYLGTTPAEISVVPGALRLIF